MSQVPAINDDEARVRAMVDARVKALLAAGPAQLPLDANDETLVDAEQLRGAILGGRSDMWVHRHLKDPNPETKFPDPDMVLSGRRYWRLGTVHACRAGRQGQDERVAGPSDDGAGGASQVKPSNANRMHRGDDGTQGPRPASIACSTNSLASSVAARLMRSVADLDAEMRVGEVFAPLPKSHDCARMMTTCSIISGRGLEWGWWR
jgi:hypothetical protein